MHQLISSDPDQPIYYSGLLCDSCDRALLFFVGAILSKQPFSLGVASFYGLEPHLNCYVIAGESKLSLS